MSAKTPWYISKGEEIALLQKCADALGKDSYCGGWLGSLIAQIKRDITSDIEPVMTIGEAHRLAEGIVAAAHEQAAAIFKAAQSEAVKTRTEATSDVTRLRGQAIDALRRSLHQLGA